MHRHPAVWFALEVVLFPCLLAAQDTTVVRSRGAGVWRNPRLVEELRFGVLEGDDQYIFGSVSALAVTRDGSIFVGDGQGPRLRLYNPQGKFVRDVGRKGSGPGEYTGIMGLQTTREGNIALWDAMNNRITVFKPSGELDGSKNVRSGWWQGDAFRADTTGNFWVFISVPMPGVPHNVEGPGLRRAAYLHVSGGGEILDTAFVPIQSEQRRIPSFVLMTSEGAAEPFTAEGQYASSNRRFFVTGISTRYAINVHRPGARVLQIQRDFEPVRLGREEKAEWDARARFYDRRGTASAGVQIPDVKPVFRSVSVDDDGRIWVDRYVKAQKRTNLPAPRGNPPPPPITWREPRTFDVFEPAGRFLGTIVLPQNTRILLARGNDLWGTRRGELDETYVVRFRLVTQ